MRKMKAEVLLMLNHTQILMMGTMHAFSAIAWSFLNMLHCSKLYKKLHHEAVSLITTTLTCLHFTNTIYQEFMEQKFSFFWTYFFSLIVVDEFAAKENNLEEIEEMLKMGMSERFLCRQIIEQVLKRDDMAKVFAIPCTLSRIRSSM